VVKAVDCDSLSVTLDDGSGSGGEERLHADVVVGADGPNSVVRSAVVGPSVDVAGVRDGHMSLTVTIPTKLMRADEDLRPLCEDDSVRLPSLSPPFLLPFPSISLYLYLFAFILSE
jgi:2-polyprenyl-6-methoxyphenol hydroxylase-like FAD-dependent oxidoreductase